MCVRLARTVRIMWLARFIFNDSPYQPGLACGNDNLRLRSKVVLHFIRPAYMDNSPTSLIYRLL
jgi:hypothetical protein